MRRSEDNIFDNYEKRSVNGAGYIVAACFCMAAVIGMIIVVFWLNSSLKAESDIVPDFEIAIDEGRYDDALQMYRQIHDDVVASDSATPGEDAELQIRRDQMASMEEIVNTRLIAIEDQMRFSRYTPSTADLRFMNEMQEMTSSRLSTWLNDLCTEFLLGTIEKPDLIFIFEAVGGVNSVASTTTPLLYEIETIEMARGDVQAAEASFDAGDYVSAVQTYVDVCNSYDGFVYDFSSFRLTEIKEIMYEPMLEEGEHMLERLRYFSAESLLSDLAVIFPDDNRINADLLEATSHTTEVREYSGTVEVLSVRQLIADVSRGASNTGLYLTTDEFERMLQQLYENDYVLVDAETMADMSEADFITEVNLTVPVGKKPLILVLDTFDYMAANTYNYGLCTQLSLDEQGHVCGQYVAPDGTLVSGRELEAIGILDSFVEAHPDFSFDGAKGVISICGYESVFGYVISRDEADDRSTALANIGRPNVNFTDSEIENNRQTVAEIMDVLLDTGWKFASSTYGNINAFDSDMETIVADTEKWMDQIESLTGDVHIIVYPGGNYIYGTDPRAEYLKSNGFRIFIGMGYNPYHIYGSNYLYYDRTPISESTLSNSDYSRLFDVTLILDSYVNAVNPSEGEDEQEVI
ncbi:MAG: hypothetical protein IJ757_03690 [Clostridiales bacterium]|nr:hypothetical protein [Clostridiales bacterium]